MARIEKFMTPSVFTIGMKQPLLEAHRIMDEHAIRHLPVLEGGELVGIVSQRDLHLIESLPGIDAEEVSVEEAMTQDVLTVEPDEPLGAVARRMHERKSGSAVVMRRGKVAGIFTAIDALEALAQLAGARETRKSIE